MDPTNPGIGVVGRKNVYMFSSINGKGIEPRFIGDYILRGADGTVRIKKANWKSITLGNSKIKELKKTYGPEALNRDLEYIKSLEDKYKKIVPKVLVDKNGPKAETNANRGTKGTEENVR